MPRSSVTATSLRPTSFSAAAGAIPMPNTGAPSRRPRNIVPALAPNFSASSIDEQCAHTALLLLHHQQVAIDDVGTGIAPAFQREQFFLIGAQMRGAVEDIGDEGRLPERKFFEC